MAIHALIFDVGGVLLQLPNDLRQRQWESDFGLAEGAIDQALWGTDLSIQATLGQIDSEAVWTWLATTLNLTAEQRQLIQHKYYVDEYLDPAMEQLLRQLRPQYKLALLTNAWSDARSVFTEKFPLSQLVDDMIISAEVGLAKPDPAIYTLALQRLGVKPEEALFIDNKTRNTVVAQRLGIASIVFQSSAQAIAEIQHAIAAAA
jgi:epoxide hydrolase-like predicted phosphatase